MHMAPNPNAPFPAVPRAPAYVATQDAPDRSLPTEMSLLRILRLLGSANIRLSIFSFETLPGAMSTRELFYAVEQAVDDTGLAFQLDDGRVGALVYGWRPPDADDSWVEDRTLDRLDWAFGGPHSSAHLVDVHAVHRWATELSDGNDVLAALSFGQPVRHLRELEPA